MTISNIFNKENISKKNPFDGVTIKNEISMSDYKAIADNVNRFVFNDEGRLVPLNIEFAIRFSIMTNLCEGIEYDEFDAEKIFSVVICSDMYSKFVEQFDTAGKEMIKTITKGLHVMIDYNVGVIKDESKNLSNTLDVIGNFLKQDGVADIIASIIDKEIKDNGETKN